MATELGQQVRVIEAIDEGLWGPIVAMNKIMGIRCGLSRADNEHEYISWRNNSRPIHRRLIMFDDRSGEEKRCAVLMNFNNQDR